MNNFKNLFLLVVCALVFAMGANYYVFGNATPFPVSNQSALLPGAVIEDNVIPSQTLGATNIGSDSATLNGRIYTRGLVNYWFEYGTGINTLLNKTTAMTLQFGTTRNISQGVLVNLKNLSANTIHYYRLKATNNYGLNFSGSVLSFTTKPVPKPVTVMTSSGVIISTSIPQNARVAGTINPNGNLVSYWFEYGETQALGLKTPVLSAGNGIIEKYFYYQLQNLGLEKKYYYRIVARSPVSVVTGNVFSFETRKPGWPLVGYPVLRAATQSSLSVYAEIIPNGLLSTYYFTYQNKGVLPGQGDQVMETTHKTLVASFSSSTVSELIPNLQPGTLYEIQFIGTNAFGGSKRGPGLFKTLTTTSTGKTIPVEDASKAIRRNPLGQ